MTYDLVTPSIGRPDAAARCWSEVRARAGVDLFWTIVVDPCPNDPEAQARLEALAQEYADAVIVRPERGSNGSAIQEGWASRGKPAPFFKIDSDVTPSPNWAAAMLDNLTAWNDGKLGAISALPLWAPRHDVGPRKVRQTYGQMIVYSQQGLNAIGDHSLVKVLHGDHDPLTFRSFIQHGLWWSLTHAAWWDWHEDSTTKDWHNGIDPYGMSIDSA